MEIEVTWRRAAKVWWSYMWRNIIAIIVAIILGGVAGLILGLIFGALGVSTFTVQMITAPIGMIIGLLVSIVPVKMILGKDFGEFRLVLLQGDAER